MVRSTLLPHHLSLTAVVLAVLLLPVALASGCGADDRPSSSPSAEAVVATVDGADVYAGDVELVRAERRFTGEGDGASAALDEAVERAIMRREAGRLGAEADEAVIGARLDELESTYGGAAGLDAALAGADLDRAQLRRIVADGVLRESLRDAKFSAMQVTPQAVRTYYRRNLRRLFTSAASVHLGAIQVRTERVAENAIGLIEGGRSFARVARQLSMDPESRANGGDLGWVLTSSLPPDLRRAVAAAGLGVIPRPVGGGNAWYALDVIGKRPARVTPLSEVREELAASLTRVKRSKALERWLDDARERAGVALP